MAGVSLMTGDGHVPSSALSGSTTTTAVQVFPTASSVTPFGPHDSPNIMSSATALDPNGPVSGWTDNYGIPTAMDQLPDDYIIISTPLEKRSPHDLAQDGQDSLPLHFDSSTLHTVTTRGTHKGARPFSETTKHPKADKPPVKPTHKSGHHDKGHKPVDVGGIGKLVPTSVADDILSTSIGISTSVIVELSVLTAFTTPAASFTPIDPLANASLVTTSSSDLAQGSTSTSFTTVTETLTSSTSSSSNLTVSWTWPPSSAVTEPSFITTWSQSAAPVRSSEPPRPTVDCKSLEQLLEGLEHDGPIVIAPTIVEAGTIQYNIVDSDFCSMDGKAPLGADKDPRMKRPGHESPLAHKKAGHGGFKCDIQTTTVTVGGCAAPTRAGHLPGGKFHDDPKADRSHSKGYHGHSTETSMTWDAPRPTQHFSGALSTQPWDSQSFAAPTTSGGKKHDDDRITTNLFISEPGESSLTAHEPIPVITTSEHTSVSSATKVATSNPASTASTCTTIITSRSPFGCTITEAAQTVTETADCAGCVMSIRTMDSPFGLGPACNGNRKTVTDSKVTATVTECMPTPAIPSS